MVKEKPKTVSEKINEIIAREVVDDTSGSDEGANEAPRVEQGFDEYDVPDARSTEIRKRNVKLLSEQSVRYSGKITSRSELERELDSEEDEEEENEEPDEDSSGDETAALQTYSQHLRNQTVLNEKVDTDSNAESDNATDSEDDSMGEAETEDGDSEDYGDEADSHSDVSEQQDATDIIAESNRQAEIQKGQCVQNQLRIWERLLELRIHTQKLLSKANQLPTARSLKEHLDTNEELGRVRSESSASISTLLNTLLALQGALYRQNSEQRSAMKNTLKRPLPTEEPDVADNQPLKRFATQLASRFTEMQPHRNAVLLKWDDRTKLLTPGAGAKRKSLAEDYDIVKKINSALQQRHTLLQRSQMAKVAQPQQSTNNGDLESTQNADQLSNVEIYDDSDFYHQQLRELIEYKANTSAHASEVTQQYVELQKLRQKMKKKVDQRASKGRKLRYMVHNKLVNFMAPDDISTWTDESRNELYKSLFAI